jgi:hypothetical protein
MSYPNCQAQQRVSLARSENAQPGKCLQSVRSYCSSLTEEVLRIETGVEVELVGYGVGQGVDSAADPKPLSEMSKQESGEVMVK